MADPQNNPRPRICGAGVSGPQDHLFPSLAHLLSGSLEEGAMEILAASNSLSATDALITARFVGHGIVGANEAWLLTEKRNMGCYRAGRDV